MTIKEMGPSSSWRRPFFSFLVDHRDIVIVRTEQVIKRVGEDRLYRQAGLSAHNKDVAAVSLGQRPSSRQVQNIATRKAGLMQGLECSSSSFAPAFQPTISSNRSFSTADKVRKDRPSRSTRVKRAMIWRTYIAIAFSILMFADSVKLAVADKHSLMSTILTEADDGSTVDIAIGASVNVFLKVPPQEIYRTSCLWSKVTTSGGDVLQEVQKAILLPTGVTAASFRAHQPGVVQLRSSRYDCLNGVITGWHVNVRVT
jgi:hypothetical protein